MSETKRTKIRADQLAVLGQDPPIIVTYQNLIVGTVKPLESPIHFPRGSDGAAIVDAFQQARIAENAAT